MMPSRLFVVLPLDMFHHMSVHLSSLLQTRMADYEDDISTVLSTCHPLKSLCDDHSSIVQEKSSSSRLPLNWSVYSIDNIVLLSLQDHV